MKTEILKISFILLICILSIFVIKDDLEHKKIRNQLILVGFGSGFLLLLVGLFFGLIQPDYLIDVFLNALIALMVAYIFWLISFWPAGDAKLFFLFSFLLPLNFYWKSYLLFFPSIVLLVNIFACAYTFLFLRSLLHLGMLIYKKDLFLLELLSRLKKLFLPGELKTFFKKLKFLVFCKAIFKALGMFLLVHFVFAARQFLNFNLVIMTILGMILWTLASLIIKKYIADSEVCVKKIDSLEMGESPLITSREVKIFGKNFINQLGNMKAEGIDKRQVIFLKKMFKAKDLSTINIQKNIPFSPWIIMGVVITILLNDNLVQFLGRFFS